MPLLITDAAVITMDGATGATPITASIRIVDDVVTAIGPGLVPQEGDEVIDGRDRLVTPGFVNAHTHSWEYLYKGRYDNLPLELWMLMSYPILGDSRVAPDLVRLRSSLFALESLKAGVTTLVDDVLENPDQDAAQLAAVFDAYDEIGIRANISGHVISRPFHETMPFVAEYLPPEIFESARAASRPTTEGYLAFSREAFATQHGRGGGRLRYMVAPSAPQRCDADLLTGATELALEHGAECHIHVLETKTQLVTGEVSYGGSLVEYLERIGALSANTTFAHGIWLSDSDMSVIAGAGTSVSHNPLSNLKLGSGIAPWRALHDAGVNLGLGTDGCSSSDSPRMLDVVKAAALLHKATDPDLATWPTVAEVLTAGTIGGARSAVLDHVTGSIEVGKQADLVLFDLETLNFTPRQRLENQLVYSENGSSIDTVIVAGRVVVSGAVSTTVDEAALRADLSAQLGEIVARQDSLDRTNGVLVEPFRRMYERAMARESSIDRFSGRRLV